EKDCKKAGAFLERPLQILEQFCSFSKNIDLEKAQEEERQYLSQLIREVAAVDKSGKKAYIETVKNRECPLLIGDALLENRAPIEKEKPNKKTFPLIRRTSLRFDYDLKSSAGSYLHLRENWEEILADWYRSALSVLYKLKLYENGYPLGWYYFSNHERHGEAEINSSMVRVYAAGARELLTRLFEYSYDKSSRKTYDLLCGNATKEQFPNRDEEGYINRGIHAIIEGNGKELTKALLARVRYIRGWYEMYHIASDEWGYSLVRLAEEAGLEYEKVVALELLDCEARQADLSKVRLENQEEWDAWLVEAETRHFKLDGIFPFVPQGKTVRRPYTSLDNLSYLVESNASSETDEIYRCCMEFDYKALQEYGNGLIRGGEHPYIGYVVRAYAHMQLYKERYDWEQVNEDLSRAITYSRRENNAFWRKLELMVRRSRALINPDKESRQYREDLEYLKNTDEDKGWYYEDDWKNLA
ncbi:MAG: hypothetical protein K2L18_12410, partial [Acetatifactor sp.]|nr:hypothetical protein [Acetatifactor sp.]